MSSPMRSDMQLLRATLAASLIFVAMAAIALAGPFEDILGAAEKGDYSTAHWLLRPLAEQGNAVAQFDLGFMYDTGHGVMQDYGEAMRWYRLAAQQGNAVTVGVHEAKIAYRRTMPKQRNGISFPQNGAIPGRNSTWASFWLMGRG
jgi:TPR repeat protein